MSQYVFGSGQLFSAPVGGGAPIRFATLQNVDVEFDGDVKELFGQFGFPLAVGRGKQKVPVKAGNGNIDVSLYNSLYFGETSVASGSYAQALNEQQTVPATPGPYTVTVTNAANFYADLGVVVQSTGQVLLPVASGPAAGQYSVNVGTGVYTFNVAQQGVAILINYLWKNSAAGHTLTIVNQLIGTQPKFQLILSETFQGNWFIMQLNSVICNKLTMPLKLDDFMISDLEMSAQVDASNTLGFISTSV